MKQKATGFPPLVGGTSLLVIFAALCLTAFALLSISTVQAEVRLGESARAAVTGYYQADCAAEEILSRLRAGELPSEVSVQDGIYSYCCPISQTQALSVQVSLAGTSYKILRWQVVSTVDWEAEDKLPVWTGPKETGGLS